MSFDRETRNKLARMVAEARRRLVADATDSLRRLGLQDDGTLVPFASLGGLSDTERGASEALRELLGHFAAQEPDSSDAIRARNAHGRLVREIGFTTLNRLVALRMAEERGLIIESVHNGFAAAGFQLFERISNGSLGSRAQTYRAYLECLYDELAVDLPSLFGRAGPESQVFPHEATLEAVLGYLNDPALADLWKEDETIGWVYQYYNDPDERKKMREASPAPRNSHELAVRNQFFTPRYVVEFLTDNTLGRTWCEMRQGDTRLRDDCRYLVRRPTEIFLQSGESAPATSDETADLSQEELLKQPVYVPFRPKKDPRDLKILDPACGSGHFLLYAFDLLQTIYEEAWGDDLSPRSEVSKRRLSEDYASLDGLRAAIPGLILRHNLYGVDIDPRAVQIAGLALWLRAQASYQRLGLRPAERPRLTRGNLVVAEPMPGEHDLLDQFVSRLDPPLIGGLVKLVFTKMQLAGEAGTILKIEEELRDAINSAKLAWQRGPKLQQLALLPEEALSGPEQRALDLDTSGISDETFWNGVTERVFAALRNFAAEASDKDSTRRRLFADDAERGFAFIDLCHKRFDVVLMNPPFGEGPPASRAYVAAAYPVSKVDIGMVFVDRWANKLTSTGFLGPLTTRTFLANEKLQKWRAQTLLGGTSTLHALADLGIGVLDDALVEVAAYVLRQGSATARSEATFLRVLDEESKATALLNLLQINDSRSRSFRFLASLSDFVPLPESVICYWLPRRLLGLTTSGYSLAKTGGIAKQGLQTADDFRFYRLFWEVPSARIASGDGEEDKVWHPVTKGGDYQPYYDDLHLLANWRNDGAEIKTYIVGRYPYLNGNWGWVVKNSDFYFRAGLAYPERTASDFSPRPLPRGSLFTAVGQAIFFQTEPSMLGYLVGSYTRVFKVLMDGFLGSGDNSVSGSAAKHIRSALLDALPHPLPVPSDSARRFARDVVEWRRELVSRDETARNFIGVDSAAVANNGIAGATLIEVKEYLSRVCDFLEHGLSVEQEQRIAFGLNESEWNSIQILFGPHPCEYARADPDTQALLLAQRSESELIVDAKRLLGARRQLTKKAYFLDRKLELMCHITSTHPSSLAMSPKIQEGFARDRLIARTEMIISYCVGVAVGRWDATLSLDGVSRPRLVGPYEAQPACPPAMLQLEPECAPIGGEPGALTHPPCDRTATNARAPGTTVGLFVDDPDHLDDIVRRVRDALQFLFHDKAQQVEEEACEILRVKDLSEYFRRPTRFFDTHLRQHSRSRREAPIYWPLATACQWPRRTPHWWPCVSPPVANESPRPG